jgi:tellurite resistance protein TehA-like permease
MSIDTETSRQQNRQAVPTGYVVLGIVLALIVVGALIFGILWLARTYPAQIETIRDVFIIALALESCIFGIVLLLMLIMLIRLVNTVEFEIKPILRQTNQTIGSVRGTTAFVSRHVVDPVVKASSYAAGVRRGVKTLFGDPRKNLPD